MKFGTVVLTGLLLFVSTGSARAGGHSLEDWKKNGSSWAPFGVGTMTWSRTTTTTNIPGTAPNRTVVYEEKRTLVSKSATTATIRVERKTGDRWRPPTQFTEKLTGPVGGAARVVKDAAGKPIVETLTIEGKGYPCTRYLGKRTRRGDADEHEQATLWVNDTLGVLKFEGALAQIGGRKLTWTVVRLAVQRKVGGLTLTGREVTIQGTGIRGTMIQCGDVPGASLGHEIRVTNDATQTVSRRELIGFTKK